MRSKWSRGLAVLAAVLFFAGALPAQAQSSPTEATPGWVAAPFTPPEPATVILPPKSGARSKGGGATTNSLGSPIWYYNTSMTQCPAGQVLQRFIYYSDNPGYHATSWCGAADRAMAMADAADAGPYPWRLPYKVNTCVAGSYWTYSHRFQDGTRYNSGNYAGIHMLCMSGALTVDVSSASNVEVGQTTSVVVSAYQAGVLSPGQSVNVSIAGTPTGSLSGCSGTTDASGKLTCTYQGGGFPGIDNLVASCSGCDNTDSTKISVFGPPQICPAKGNPIYPSSALKVQRENDIAGFGPHALEFTRIYRSDWARGSERIQPRTAAMGQVWSHSHAASLDLVSASQTRVVMPGGEVTTFVLGAGVWTPQNGSIDSLVPTGTGDWTFRNSADESAWLFDSEGRVKSRTDRNGWVTTYVVDTWFRVSQATNHFGRVTTFGYNAQQLLSSVTFPGGQVVTFGYDGSSRLTSATYPGGAVKTYHYEDTAYPQALTGITDENGLRYATYGYDSLGRAVSSQHAGGAGAYSVVYGSNWSATLTDPLGTQIGYTFGGAAGRQMATSATLPSESGDAASVIQNAFGLPESQVDFLGTTKQYAWDTARRLPTSVTEAANRTEARTITTAWHPSFKLPALVTEAGRTTAYTYDASGNKLTKSVSDGGQTRTWAWTYDASNLMTASSEPNGATTTYGYDMAKNLTSITDPLGHVMTMGYDAIGRVTSITQPTGLQTSFTYDGRNRVLTSTRGGLVTTYTYRPSGQVATLSLPSGHSMTFAYDNAQRLTGWADNRSAQAVYTLDAMGNRTVEQVKDGLGNTVWQLARTINNINRVTAETLGVNQGVTYGYDANGNLTSETNGLSQSTSYTLDGHKRVTALTNAASASAQIAYNAIDGVTGASDFKASATGYTRNAFGEATQETSADAGTRSTQYNSLGLPTLVTDAMSQATSIQRDVLGRPTLLTFADSKTTILRYDLTGSNYNAAGAPNASKGYLSEIEDRAGITRWQRDIHGRVTQKVQTLANGAAHTTGYTYNAQGLLETITYPAGGVLGHVYSAAGQLTGLTWNGSALISNIAWNAMGQPTGWTWAFNSAAASRSYDTAGRVSATEFSSYGYDAAGRITSLTQNLGQPADSNPLSSSVTFVNKNFTVTYDAVGRITGFGDGADSTIFTYDSNGNRLTSTRVEGSTTTVKTYSVQSGGNRLLGYTQQVTSPSGSASTSISYSYNANGEMTGDGLSQYGFNAENRLSSVTVGNTQTSPTTRYAHNALGQRVFKTEPLYEDIAEEPGDSGFWASLSAFFSRLWNPSVAAAEQLGFAFSYDEEGTLIGEYGSGGAQSTGTSQYIWLPTPSGPMPVAAIVNGAKFAVHSDHLNTPRKLTNEQGATAWQWKYSAFGDEQPTRAANRFVDPEKTPGMGSTSIADVIFNHRYSGQYADKESGLYYNWWRTLDSDDGRYTQSDPIGLNGGWNRFSFARQNTLLYSDATGLKVEVRCRPVGSPTGERSFQANAARFAGGEHCYLVVHCPEANIDMVTISYLGTGMAVVPRNKGTNNDTVYSDMFNYRPLDVPSTSSQMCPRDGCAMEKCIVANAQSLLDQNYRVPNYSAISGPNSNSVARRLVEMCKGAISGTPPPTGWNATGKTGF